MKKCTVRLPPDDDTLNHHLERTNCITYCQMHYDLLEHLSPIGYGWEFMNGKCRPVRHTHPPLPHELIPLIAQMTTAMGAVAMTTVIFLTQLIQMYWIR